ncbi:hypothetical protein ACW5F0_05785 [Luteimonas sp. A534]
MHTPQFLKRPHDLIAGALLGIVVVLFLKRYAGINHDAVLYLGQGLVRRWPEIFGSDLTFIHGGGQERYTVFPWLMEQSIRWAPPGAVFATGALVSILLFAAASWYCLHALLPAGQRYWAWLGIAVLPSAYGMSNMFAYSEQFVTPRPFAEAFCLVAIGLLARQHLLAALVCATVAAAFHPLQTVAAALVVWPWLVMQDRRWLHALWAVLPVTVLAMAGIAPFDGLLHRLDPEWVSNLRKATRQLFLTSWRSADLNLLAFDALLLAYAWRGLDMPFARWCAAALAGLGLGMLANLALVDGLQLVLPAQLQLWRVHWLAHWFAMGAVVLLLVRDLGARDVSRALLLMLTVLLVRSMASWSWPLLAILYAAWPVALAGRERLRRPLAVLFGLAIAALFAIYLSSELAVFRAAHYRFDLYAFDRRVVLFPVIGLGLPALAVLAWKRLPASWRTISIVFLLLPLVVLAATRWDARSPVNLALEQSAFQSDVFGVDIPEDAQVYWGQHTLTGPWLVLRRASYFSPHQVSGQVFNRALSVDANVRVERMRTLIEMDLGCEIWSASNEAPCHIGDEGMRRACSPGPEPVPDYLVLVYRQPQRSLGSWTIMDPVTQEPATTYHLYRCADVMEDLQEVNNVPASS